MADDDLGFVSHDDLGFVASPQAASAPQMPFYQRLPMDALKGVTDTGASMLSTPLQSASGVVPGASQLLNGVSQIQSASPIQNPSFSDKAVQFLSGTIPFGGDFSVPTGLARNAGEGLMNLVSPKSYANNVLDTLSSGQNSEEIGQSLAQRISSAYNAAKLKSSSIYQGLTDQFGNQSIYQNAYPSLKTENGEALGLSQDSLSGFPNAQDALDNFTSNPNFNNAHTLQSELAAAQREMQSSPVGSQGRLMLGSVIGGRNTLLDHIGNFLTKNGGEDAANTYQGAAQDYLQNVAPYRSTSLFDVSTGKDPNPGINALKGIFGNPNDSVQKIAQDIGSQGRNEILSTALDNVTNRNNAQTLVNNFNRLDEKGLSSYVSPELQNSINGIGHRQLAQKIMAGLGISGLGGYLGYELKG